ncbi:MAG: TetR/AcrR family transcriptional regulator [Polyangiaceae bacterium]
MNETDEEEAPDSSVTEVPEDRAPRRLTRAEKKERTRSQLIQAAAELARTGGVAAVTTTAVTARVGVTQPAFYVHFKNVDEILAVAAEEISSRITQILREVRAAGRERGPIENSENTVRQSLEALISEPAMIDIFLRYRRDTTSALGNAIMACEARARRELAEDLAQGAAKVGFDMAKLPPLTLVADTFVSLFIGALESIRDERAELEDTVKMLQAVIRGTVGYSLMRQSQAG